MSRFSVVVRVAIVAGLLAVAALALQTGPLGGLLSGGIGPLRLDPVTDPAGGTPSVPGTITSPDPGTPGAPQAQAPASSTSSETTGANPPAVDAVIEGTLGSNGWYTSDVALSWKIEGGTAAEGSCAAETINTDGTTEHSCTATAEDGSTRTTKATIARDATAPSPVTVSADRAPDHNGWYNKPFTATWKGEDATSGVASCTKTDYSGPDNAAGSLDGSCADNAGNTSPNVAFAFQYDATAPAVTATAERSADHNGWYNRPVKITWASESGATCDEPRTYAGPDASSVTINGKCTDQAGNEGTASVTLAYDETAPVIVLTTPADGATYVLRQPVAADYKCSDATSGVDACTGTVADGANIDTGSVGSHSFKVKATDQAGNEAAAGRTYSIQYAGVGTLCGGVRGHEILQPIAADGSSVFNQGRTVPAKFRVCDYFGVPVTTPGVVTSFRIVSVDGSTVDRAPTSTSSHQEFRAGEGQWIYNIDTKPLAAGRYGFRISLDDGTAINFAFTLRSEPGKK